MDIDSITDFADVQTEALHYRPDGDKIIRGRPELTLYNHYTSPCGRFSAGVWEGSEGLWRIDYTEHEYCEIISGTAVLRDEAGGEKTLRPGDRFIIPAGFKGTWEVVEPCRKYYAVFENKD